MVSPPVNSLRSPASREVDLRGQEGRRLDLVLPRLVGVEVAERRGERRPGNAIADRVHALDVEQVANRVDRVDLALQHIIVERRVGDALVGRLPADHEQGHALVDAPFHEAFLGREVEDVEAVDPRREDRRPAFPAPRRSSACTGSAGRAAVCLTTLPGVIARLRPTSNTPALVCVSWPDAMSLSMLARPLSRFSPRVSIVRLSTCGLVSAKLDGLIASTKLRTSRSAASRASPRRRRRSRRRFQAAGPKAAR